ncbi:SNARE associated Golgi protein [Gloeothece citriformis PCC 7424]|uniref:SNARE associated Golgi protein n=1 Tax=Gloeothece citriformis (strain PCC 7424) TaxID=65393 RepID=B7KDV5_GLOC7|nr:DedA family protein [Gloeothece citriformis]ACK70407.1 SNARE associated Golgi protein [Gloeothece citriformis PCC 7424]
MAEWIVNLMNTLGYGGIALLMFLENLFPPIPSELIMPLAGFTVAQGKMQLIPAIAAGVFGTILGAFPWYYLGVIFEQQRLEKLADKYGKWVTISSTDVRKANHWFGRHGTKAVFFGRLVPGIRTIISLPAGMNRMPLITFVIYSTLGTTLWIVFLTLAGYLLGENYKLVEDYIGPISKIALLSVIFGFIIWIIRKNLRQRN